MTQPDQDDFSFEPLYTEVRQQLPDPGAPVELTAVPPWDPPPADPLPEVAEILEEIEHDTEPPPEQPQS